MQRLNKNLASSAIAKIANTLKSGEIRQLEILLDLMSEDGVTEIGKLRAELFPQSTEGNKASANVAINRLINRINDVFAVGGSKVRLTITADKKAGDNRECWFETELVEFPIPFTPQLDAIPENQREQDQLGQPLIEVDIVLITFNQHELDQTLKCFCPNAQAVQIEGHARVYYELGQHGGHNLVLIHSQQATIEAMRSVEIAIDVFRPNAIIAVGIAFGISSQKQKIGEVLISESIIPYELARINHDGSITPRGSRPPASKTLRDWFHQLDAHLNKEGSAEYAKRYFGSMFSGDKLIDNQNYRDQLLQLDSTAIGGEMEGTGIFRACEATKTDWIIVKAICDFADGKKGENKDANQKVAAENAARLVKAVLEFGSLYPIKKARTKSSLKSIHDYKAKCTNLSEIDERALVKNARALPTTLKKEQAALIDQDHINGIPVVAKLLNWAKDPQGKTVFTLLGEYGMGKTVNSQMFDKQLREQSQQNKTIPVSLYFDLRHVTSKTLQDGFHFSDIIQDCIRFGFFKSETQDEFTTYDIERWANQSGVVLIFDGLDEVLVKLPESDGRIFTDQLYKYQAELKVKSKQPIKMLLTCRSQYFKTLDRQKDHFTGQERGGVSTDDIETMIMLPFTEEQTTNYLRNALPGIDPATIIDMVKSVHDLHDLSKRPFTLKLVGEFFPALEEDRKAGKAISGVSLYRRVVDRWLNRDDGKHQIKRDHKLQLASHLAALLWKQKQSALPASEIEDWFMGWLMDNPRIAFRYQGVKPELLEEDLRTATFLCREDDEQGSRFRFSHTSLQEFFLANYLLQAISDEKPEYWTIAKPSRETLVFLAQLLAEPEYKHLLSKLADWRSQYRQHTSENLLHYALVAFSLGFSIPTLHSIQLNGAILSDLNIQAVDNKIFSLENANFSGACLIRAQFSFVNLNGTNFNNAQLNNSEFNNCKLNNTHWYAAEVIATRFVQCQLDQANLNEAKAYRSKLLACKTSPLISLRYPMWLTEENVKNVNTSYGIAGHTASINVCAFSEDGKHMASGSFDNNICLWDTESGDLLRKFTGRHSGITSCIFSENGQYLVSASYNKTLCLWNVKSGECLRTFIAHEKIVTSCAIDRHGNLVSGYADGTLCLWGKSGGACLQKFVGHTLGIRSCIFSGDNKYLISGSEDKSLRLWDTETGRCLQVFQGHSGCVNSCALSKDGCILVSGSSDETLRLWDVATGECLREFKEHQGSINCCAISPDNRYISYGSDHENFCVFDRISGERAWKLIGHTDLVMSCAFSSDGKYLISGSYDHSSRMWDMSNGEFIREFKGYDTWVKKCTLNVTEDLIISLANKKLQLWNKISGEFFYEFIVHKEQLSCFSISADGQYLIAGSEDGVILLWNMSSKELIYKYANHKSSISGCEISKDSNNLISIATDGSVCVRELTSGKILKTFAGVSGWFENCAFNKDGTEVIAAKGNDIHFWDINSGECLRVLTGHNMYINCFALSYDGLYLVSVSLDHILRLWDLKNGKCLREFEGNFTRCAISKDSNYLISGDSNGLLHLWDMKTGKCLYEFIGHTMSITNCVFSDDSKFIISSSGDSSIRIWSVSNLDLLTTIYIAQESNYLSVNETEKKITDCSEYSWRYFNSYFTNSEGSPDSFPIMNLKL